MLACFLAVLLAIAGVSVVTAQPAQAASCGDVLVAASAWPGGVEVRHNGPYQGTATPCVDDDGVFNLSASPPRWGLGWQCVELAARLYAAKGWSNGLPGVDFAAQIYTNASSLGMTAMSQGQIDITKIVPGDMVISNQATYGHVSVVSSVDLVNNVVHTVEQNANADGRADYTFSPATKRLTRGAYYQITGVVHDPDNILTNGGGNPTALPDAQVIRNLDIPGFYYVAVGGSLFWYNGGQNPGLHAEFVSQMNQKIEPDPPIKPMYDEEIRRIEANYPHARTHPPRDNTFLIDKSNNGWYIMQYGYAWHLGSTDEVAYLDGNSAKAVVVPPNAATVMQAPAGGPPPLPLGTILQTIAVNDPDYEYQRDAFGTVELLWANNHTVQDCIKAVKGAGAQRVPQSLINHFLGAGTYHNNTSVCTFNEQVVFYAPGGAERWQITGNNTAGAPYVRRKYASTLAMHCYRGPAPTQVQISVGGVNGPQQSTDIHCPNNTYLRNNQSGQVFQWWDGQLHYVSSPELLSCLTQGQPQVVIPLDESAFGGASQGAPAVCHYEGKLLQAPNGQVFWIHGGQRRYVGNSQIVSCLAGRANAGVPIPVSYDTVNSFGLGAGAYCPYPASMRFVRGEGQAEVWRVYPGGTRQHAGSLCQPQTDPRYYVHVVPAGEVDGHGYVGVFEATASACAAIT